MANVPANLRFFVFLASTYALLGAVGLTLAIPPGYASPIFPACGLALAAVLLYGRRAIFGVWLGSFLLNFINGLIFGTVGVKEVVVAAGIAGGAALQAWLGAVLVSSRQKESSWRELGQEKDFFVFMMLGGGVATIVSPSVGLAAMLVAGIIDKSQILYTWLHWYVGDCLGVLVFAPLALCLLNRDSELWRQRRKVILAPMLITIAMVFIAFWGASRWEKQVEQNNLQTDGEAVAKRITDRLITHREVLASLSHFIEAIPDCSFEQFEKFTLSTLHDNPDIFALSLNDVVNNDKRQTYEQLISSLSPLGTFKIMERDNEKQLVPAAVRPEYVAVRYIVPIKTNRQAVGFDINSEPNRKDTIKRARILASMAVTSPIQLVQEEKKHTGLLALWPVNSRMTSHSNSSETMSGFAVVVLKIDQTIDIATQGYLPEGLAIEVSDPQAPMDRTLLYRSNQEGNDNAATQPSPWQTVLQMGDRTWLLSVHTTSAYQQQHRSWMAWIVGVVGLIFAALLQIMVLGMTGRTTLILRKNKEIEDLARTLEGKVDLRTAELNETMQSYRDQFMLNSAAMLLVAPENRKIIDGNNAAAAFYGYSRHQLRTMCLDDISIHPAEQLQEATSLILQGMANKFQSQDRLADGSLRHVEDSVSVIYFGGRKVLFLIIHDITERKRAEEALCQAMETLEQRVRERSQELEKLHAEMVLQEKMASVGQLAAGIAHEINTPMQFISTNMEFLEEANKGLSSMTKNFMEVIPRAPAVLAERMQLILDEADCEFLLAEIPSAIRQSKEGIFRVSSIVKAMKEFSHPSSGVRKNVAINPIIETTVLITQNEWKYVADIKTDLAHDLPAVTCYIDELSQVLLNLMINAAQSIGEKLEAHPDGQKGIITISTKTIDKFIEICVQDTGTGIPEEIRSKIFDPFFTTKEVGRGIGQGLTISHDVITVKHGGTLNFKTEVGEGTTFIIRLPVPA